MTSTISNMHRPSAILAEDEPLLAAEMQEILVALWPELDIVGIAPDGIAALHLIEKHKPDFVFLDIEMPRMNGLQVARQVGDRAHIVFVTAFDQHAVSAFEAGALDYVLKPASTERLAATVQRLKSRAGTAPVDLSQFLDHLSSAPRNGKKHLQWINAARGSTMRLITVDEICYFKADHKYTLVVTADSESLIKKTIRDLQEELDPDSFWQIHRSTVVNVNTIESVVRDDRGGMQLKVKRRPEMLQVSEAYGHLFKQM